MNDNNDPRTDDKKTEDELEDLTPEKDPMGGTPHVKPDQTDPLIGAQKKEITEE